MDWWRTWITKTNLKICATLFCDALTTTHFLYYYNRHKCFTGKYSTGKIHTKLHPGSSGVFILSSDELYLNSLVYDQNIFGSSSKVLENLRKVFGKCPETSSGLRNNFGKSSEIFGNYQKRRHQYIYIIKRILHVSSKIWTLCSRGKNNISRVRYCSCHSNIAWGNSCLLATV